MRMPKIVTTIRDYSWPLFLADLLAGLTVALVALPLSLAIAIASGADPAKGLTTAIIAGFMISLLGGSRVQIGGPTGAFIVVVFGVIAEHGYDGLVLATFMAGLILLVAGWFRAGRLIAGASCARSLAAANVRRLLLRLLRLLRLFVGVAAAAAEFVLLAASVVL